MKYENPTCEIVFISSADCTLKSGEKAGQWDSPLVDWAASVNGGFTGDEPVY